jgi:hypothetical protein
MPGRDRFSPRQRQGFSRGGKPGNVRGFIAIVVPVAFPELE